jgi:hypothetical protein
MSLSEKELDLFKRWLRGLLADRVVNVTFTKKDGTERVMNCTINPSMVPETKNSTKKINESIMNVYDVELNAWKSFRWESIKQVRVTLE